jgi:hypothetical protein
MKGGQGKRCHGDGRNRAKGEKAEGPSRNPVIARDANAQSASYIAARTNPPTTRNKWETRKRLQAFQRYFLSIKSLILFDKRISIEQMEMIWRRYDIAVH